MSSAKQLIILSYKSFETDCADTRVNYPTEFIPHWKSDDDNDDDDENFVYQNLPFPEIGWHSCHETRHTNNDRETC